MHRLGIEPDGVGVGVVTFSRAQAHQLRTVLRIRPGELVTAVVFGQAEYLVRMELVDRDRAAGVILAERTAGDRTGVRIILAQGLLREQKMDIVIQKATELGVDEIQPLICARSVARPPGSRQERWNRIAQEASEQSGRTYLPEITATLPFRSLTPTPALDLALDERETDRGIGDVLAQTAPDVVRLLIGPEGGFSDEERAFLRFIGAVTVGFGPRVLRAETAAIAAVTSVALVWGDLGQPAEDRSWNAVEERRNGEAGG